MPLLAAPSAQTVARTMPDYRIGSFDELQVTVASPVPQPQFGLKNYRVQTDGTIQLPQLLKPVKVGGMTTQEAREAIRQALMEAKQYESPIVDVQVAVYRNSSATVQGAVRSPGNVDIPADRMTISEAISKAGGLQTTAGSRIYVRGGPNRPKPEADVLVIDGAEVYRKTDVLEGRVLDPRIYDGDMITVEIAPHFYVTGFVKSSQSEYNWEPGITLQTAIALAGGATPEGALNRITVDRKDPKTGAFKKIKLAKNKMSTPIEPDDVIYVPKRRM
jgi:protein involved in polysaccharide export with SLBB domain